MDMFVCCVGSGLCDELITGSGESCCVCGECVCVWLCVCVVVCVWGVVVVCVCVIQKPLQLGGLGPVGLSRHREGKKSVSDCAAHPHEMCGMLMTQFTNCVSAWRLVGDLHREGDCGVVTWAC